MSARDNHALIAACDCYVSLHRSEGFALTPAEAMALGKPVIATGYSGNLDYMTSSNAYLVDYEMTPIGPGNAPYSRDGEWAQPDVEHAARLMREVFGDPASARTRGARGAADVARTHSLQAAGRSMQRRLEGLSARVTFPERELVSMGEVLLPAAEIEPGGRLRGRIRRAFGRKVRRSIEEDLVSLRRGIEAVNAAVHAAWDGSYRAIREVDLVAIEAANDAARNLAATLAALRRLQLAEPDRGTSADVSAAEGDPRDRGAVAD
jgi:hypothetical protein